MNDTRTVRIIVEGRVQGVGFRAFVAREAERRAVGGFVRNRADGNVECVAQGHPDAIAALCDACGRGPLGSHVARVDIRDAESIEQYAAFKITHEI